jgi:hypothetical protein
MRGKRYNEIVWMSETTTMPESISDPRAMSAERLHDAIRQRAEQIYLRSGGIPGRDLENWAQAESQILLEMEKAQRRTAVVIAVNGVQYVGEYDPNACDGYLPGEFQPGQPLSIRFDGEKMLVQRANGSELETTIVARVG